MAPEGGILLYFSLARICFTSRILPVSLVHTIISDSNLIL